MRQRKKRITRRFSCQENVNFRVHFNEGTFLTKEMKIIDSIFSGKMSLCSGKNVTAAVVK
jgi:hypothetical protein